jgi:hypothetical protein
LRGDAAKIIDNLPGPAAIGAQVEIGQYNYIYGTLFHPAIGFANMFIIYYLGVTGRLRNCENPGRNPYLTRS